MIGRQKKALLAFQQALIERGIDVSQVTTAEVEAHRDLLPRQLDRIKSHGLADSVRKIDERAASRALIGSGEGRTPSQEAHAVAADKPPSSPVLHASVRRAEKQIIKSIGYRFHRLALDEPGILHRLGHFLRFAHRELSRRPRMSKDELRQAYDTFLGSVELVRGLSTDDPERIRAMGMDSPFVYYGRGTYEDILEAIRRDGVEACVKRQLGGKPLGEKLLDVTSEDLHPEIRANPVGYLIAHPELVAQLKARSQHSLFSSVSRNPASAEMMASARSDEAHPGHVFYLKLRRIDIIWGSSFESWTFRRILPEQIVGSAPAYSPDFLSGRPPSGNRTFEKEPLRQVR